MDGTEIKTCCFRGDERMKTIKHLMLKDSPEHQAILTNGKSKDLWTIRDLINYTNTIDVVVERWANAVSEHLERPEEIEAEIYGSLMITRMLISDLEILEHNPNAECISLLDGTQIITDLKQKMLPMSKSYAKVPSLAQWYMTLPSDVDMAYRNIRRRLKDGSK